MFSTETLILPVVIFKFFKVLQSCVVFQIEYQLRRVTNWRNC
jgi:hypothetical protein